MIMTDQDHDGSHIKGLIINFIAMIPEGIPPKTYVFVLLGTTFLFFWASGVEAVRCGGDHTGVCSNETFAMIMAILLFIIAIVDAILWICCASCSPMIHTIGAMCLFGGWVLSVIWFTFSGPFTNGCATLESAGTGGANGYFAVWLCLLVSAAYLQATFERAGECCAKLVPTGTDGLIVGGLFIGSVVVLGQSLFDCAKTGSTCSGTAVWGMLTGLVSGIIALLMIFVRALDGMKKFVAIFLACWWFVAVATLTYNYKDYNPLFSDVGNGYISVWACAFISVVLTYSAWSGMEELPGMGVLADPKVYAGIVFVASFFEFWAAGALCGVNGSWTGIHLFAVIIGIVSFIVAAILVALYMFAQGAVKMVSPFISAFLVIWWVIAVVFCVFGSPFKSPCTADISTADSDANGYFTTWIACAASVMLLLETEKVKNMFNAGADRMGQDGAVNGALLFASAVCFIQAAYDCGSDGGCGAGQGWAITIGVISFVLACLVMFVSALAPFKKFIFGFLSIWWFIAVLTLTFPYNGWSATDYIYASLGNGFISVWVGMGVSCYLAATAFLGPMSMGAAGEADGNVGVEANASAGPATEPIGDTAVEGQVTVSAEEGGDEPAAENTV
jgi:hypothetical protein